MPAYISILLSPKSLRLALVVALVSITAMTFYWASGSQTFCESLLQTYAIADAHRVAGLFILFVVCFCLFLTIVPAGTLIILLAGFLFGPLAGPVQFAAIVCASLILYEIGKEGDPERLERELTEWPKLAAFAGLAKRRGFTFSVLMRLTPVVPSAVASLGASYFSVSRKDFILGTLAAGWVRPVGFALLGSLGRFAPICGIDPSIALSGA